MRLNLGKSLHLYHTISLILLTVTLGAGVNYFWSTGAVNLNNISNVFEASLQVDELRNNKKIEEIRSLVNADRVRDAVGKVEKLEKFSKQLNTVVQVKKFDDFKKDLLATKSSLNGLLSYPEISSLLGVLRNKVLNFESFVVRNNWRTLTRLSRRVKTRLNTETKSNFTYGHEHLTALKNNLNKDFKIMERVTTNSVLSSTDKNLILTNLKTLETEVKMLEKYLGSLKSFDRDFAGLEKTFKSWFGQVEPEIVLQRMKFEESSRNLMISLISFVGLMIFITAFGFWVNKRNSNKSKDLVEKEIIETIKDGLIPQKERMSTDGFSSRFKNEFNTFREYIHKRMSFGAIFQDATPFSCLLLDSNLNMVWANPLFFESWNLVENGKKDAISWDYLQRFTNLGDNDPVLAAVHDNVAGIYQIQVRTGHNEESLPFEMYVSPVEYAGQKRIMILFYPLRSLEETLEDQTRSIVGPITRTLQALAGGHFDPEFQEKIRRDFEIAGIGHLFEKFEEYHRLNREQQNELYNELEDFETRMFDKHKLFSDVRQVFDRQNAGQIETLRKFHGTKEAIISTVEARGELNTLFQKSAGSSKRLLKQKNELLTSAEKINETLRENKKSFETMTGLKNEFKELRGKVDEFKQRLVQLLDQSLIFQKSSDSNPKMEQSLNQIKMEVKGFDKVLGSFSQIMTSLDVCLSKVSLVMEESEPIDLNDFQASYDEIREEIESAMFDVGRLNRDAGAKEEHMVETLKELYMSFQASREKLADLGSILASEDEDESDNLVEFEKVVSSATP